MVIDATQTPPSPMSTDVISCAYLTGPKIDISNRPHITSPCLLHSETHGPCAISLAYSYWCHRVFTFRVLAQCLTKIENYLSGAWYIGSMQSLSHYLPQPRTGHAAQHTLSLSPTAAPSICYLLQRACRLPDLLGRCFLSIARYRVIGSYHQRSGSSRSQDVPGFLRHRVDVSSCTPTCNNFFRRLPPPVC